MTGFAEERIAELIATLPSAPGPWVKAAIELPQVRAAIDDLVADALSDRARRKEILADMEFALRAAGVEPRPQLVGQLRARLGVAPGE